MAGADNLKPFRSVEEAREKGRKGGKASGKARRAKKSQQEYAAYLLNLPLKSGELEEYLSIEDIKGKNITAGEAALIVQMKKAVEGDAKAYEIVRDTAGERPVEKVEVNADIAKASADIEARIAAMKARHQDDGR